MILSSSEFRPLAPTTSSAYRARARCSHTLEMVAEFVEPVHRRPETNGGWWLVGDIHIRQHLVDMMILEIGGEPVPLMALRVLGPVLFLRVQPRDTTQANGLVVQPRM